MDTVRALQDILDRYNAGDREAKNVLLERSMNRLQAQAERLLREDRVRNFYGADDLLQETLIRLTRRIENVQPKTAEQFLQISASEMHRALKDLARKLFGPQGYGRHQAIGWESYLASDADSDAVQLDVAVLSSPSELERRSETWVQFYEKINEFPEQVREVFKLVWFEQLSYLEVAQLLGVDQRTVRNRLRMAKVKLGELLLEINAQTR